SWGPTKQFQFWLYLVKTVVGQIISNEGNKELLPVESIENLAVSWRLPDGIFHLKNGVILTP
ncbi:putative signal peptide protein, partial [Puccinia sorghi]